MKKILIIDDEKIIRERLKKLLDIDGYRTLVAENGHVGLEIYHKEKPNIVIVDLKMPGMDGIEVLKKIKGNAQKAEVIIITGHGALDSAIKAVKIGAFDYIGKPIDYNKLEITIKKALEKQKIQIKLDKSIIALSESEERLRGLVNALPDVVFLVDQEGCFIEILTSQKDLLVQNGESAIGKHISEVLPRQLAQSFLRAIERVIKTGNIEVLEYELNVIKGRRWFEGRLSPLSQSTGDKHTALIVSRDITRHKQAKKALKQSEEKWRSLVENAPNKIIIVNREGKIQFANHSESGITEIIGGSIYDLIKSEYRQMVETIIEQVFSTGESAEYEVEIINPSGNTIWYETKVGPIIKDGQVDAITLISTDISSRKQSEDELLLAKKAAETANKAKSAFLANMSHELRTPLNSLLGFSQFLETRQIGPLNEKQLEYLADIRASGKHLLEMVNDVLDLSKIEANKIVIKKKPFDLNMMLSRSPSTIKSLADKKNIDMKLNIHPALGDVTADEVRIKQIIYNLLSNAIKFTEPGKNIGLDAYGSDDRAIISVWDEGMGIPAKDLKRIFKPFEQVKSTMTGKPEGTGLGLSISKKLVELHDGTLEVESKEGAGTRFTIALPNRKLKYSKDKVEKYRPEKIDASIIKFNGNILVVEDNIKNQKLLESILTESGFEVLCVETGEEALDILSSREFDLVLMDIQLPGIDGIEAMKRIKKSGNHMAPILAVTAYAMKGDKEKFLNHGFDDYISKPIDYELLMGVLRKYFEEPLNS